MSTDKPSYWAVLPAAVRYDPKIPASAKLLYAEISSLTGSRGFCYASNAYFAGLYGITERTLQRHLKALESGGYIRIQDGAGGSETRKIYAGVNPLAENPVKNEGVPPTKLSGVCSAYSTCSNKKRRSPIGDLLMERVTRLELATSTLARWRSTG